MSRTIERQRGLGAGRAMLAAGCLMSCAAVSGNAGAQMPIGSVSTMDATVTGASLVVNDRAELGTNGTIVAKDHAAYVQLIRGGSVKVCATSGVHLTAGSSSTVPADAVPPAAGVSAGGAGTAIPGTAGSGVVGVAESATLPGTGASAWAVNIPPPLMVALDRGAMELRMGAIPGDIVMTPDLRLSFNGDGLLDVHIRVGRNGDTCVENRVVGLSGHPGLKVGSLFGSETYDVMPGQHVLFEGGNLHEVVDNESSPCGCPEATALPAPEIGDLSLKKAPKSAATRTAAQHPFPADVSQGLAPPPPVPQAPPGVTHTQISTTLAYNASSADGQARKDDAVAPAASTEKPGFFRSIGRFLRRLF